jgi:hypothetical protein
MGMVGVPGLGVASMQEGSCSPTSGEGAVMARRTFDVIDLIEVFEHWWAGRSQVQIAASLGIDRKTVRYAEVGITDLMPTLRLCRPPQHLRW